MALPPTPATTLMSNPQQRRTAWFAFWILFSMTLFDYMDRNILGAVVPNLTMPKDKGGLGLTNEQGGSLATVFLITYAVVSPFMGWAGDRFRRSRLLFIGVGVWSLATVGSGLARSYGDMVLARTILGVGEATYGAIAPTILLDLFPKRWRSRLLSYFYLAMPIGSALGFVIGGSIAKHYGWHYAFFVVGAPGLLLAFLALLLPDPKRGASDDEEDGLSSAPEDVKAPTGPADYTKLAWNRSYVVAVLGMATYTFAIGGLIFWFPKFLIAARGIPQDKASLLLGAITCVAAIAGMAAGGWLADKLAKTRPGALFWLPGLAMLAALPFLLFATFSHNHTIMFASVFIAEALMFVNTGPCNAAIANVVSPRIRAAAYAISTFFIHFLGDIWSPVLMGRLADQYGQPEAMKTGLGPWLASIGATPTLKQGAERGEMENLTVALLIVIPFVLISGLILIIGSRFLANDSRRPSKKTQLDSDISSQADFRDADPSRTPQ